MPPISKKTTGGILLLLVMLIGLVSIGTASASRKQMTVIEDPGRVLSSPEESSSSLDETAALGADIVKIPVSWRNYAPEPESASKPAGDLSDPSNYAPAVWTRLDTAISGAQARGLKVWLAITAPAPRWAVAQETSPGLGAYSPDPASFGQFVSAVARRYADVHIFSIWNEPNLKRFLQPQKQGSVISSAVHYRAMYRAAYEAFMTTGHAKDTILFGELMPRSPARNDPQFSAPLAWLRDFFCIDRKGRPLRGSAAARRNCGGFRKIRASGLAYHPYRLSGTPLSRETVSADYAAINYLPRVERLLDAAYGAGRLATKRLPIYSSEFGFQSNPPDPIGSPISKVPSYLNISEYLGWSDPRVATYSQYLIVDDVDLGAFQTGLRFSDGTPKPFVYEAFQTPFLVTRTSRKDRVSVWGCLRAKPAGSQPVEIQYLSGGAWRTATTISVLDESGYFVRTVGLEGASSKVWRAVWSGGTSRTTKAIAPVAARRD